MCDKSDLDYWDVIPGRKFKRDRYISDALKRDWQVSCGSLGNMPTTRREVGGELVYSKSYEFTGHVTPLADMVDLGDAMPPQGTMQTVLRKVRELETYSKLSLDELITKYKHET